MKLDFDNNFQKKVMVVRFAEPTHIGSAQDIQLLRQKWTEGLASWHSPYRALMDCSDLEVDGSQDLVKDWQRFEAYLKGFFLKSLYLFNTNSQKGHSQLPFASFSEDEARSKVGLNRQRQEGNGDLRSSIHIQNHFQQHVMELSFDHEIKIENAADVATVKAKITNNLMQWHSPWNLLIDCHHLAMDQDAYEPWQTMTGYFKSFFMKRLVGYNPQKSKEDYPFPVFRSRHKAAASCLAEGAVSGNDAHCRSQSKKSAPKSENKNEG